LNVVFTGSFIKPVPRASERSSRIAPATSEPVASSDSTTMTAGSGLPGNSAWIRS
jgi:hypothetical protein